MSTFWSNNVQGPKTLFYSRIAKFSNDKKDIILQTLKLKSGMKILVVGCGPGALSIKLSKWLGEETEVIGLDRDKNLIEFAESKRKEEKLNNIQFIEGDALNLPFADNEFDVCLSHTVIEHVPNLNFLVEQKRVCKAGGKVIVMSVMPNYSINIESEISKLTQREKELWKPINEAWDKKEKGSDVGKYKIEPREFPFIFKKAGLINIDIEALALRVAVDNYTTNRELANIIFKSEHEMWMEILENGLNKLNEKLPPDHIKELKELINKRDKKRRKMCYEGEKIWDYNVSMVLIGIGYKS